MRILWNVIIVILSIKITEKVMQAETFGSFNHCYQEFIWKKMIFFSSFYSLYTDVL